MTPEPSPANNTRDRSPCFPALIALSSGIACDHAFLLSHWLLFAAGGSLVIASLLIRTKRRAWSVAAVLGLLAITGAASHHVAWSDRGVNSITRYLRDEPQLVRITGIVASNPSVDRRRDAGRKAAWPLDDRTRLTISATSIGSADATADRPVTGTVQITTAGHVIDVGAGDEIEVVGWLRKPGRARNPGGFDADRFLRLKGIDAALHADHPEAVRRIASGGIAASRLLGRFRERLGYQFAEHLSTENAPVGIAMILGERTAIPDEVRDAYMATGAMHVLSISGLHVGILATFLTFLLRLTRLSPAMSLMLVTGLIWSYAALTDWGPPVLRASIFCTIWAAAAVLYRRSSLLNIASVTAVMLLLWNPLLLFDVGARLSFLAILGMAWSLRMFPNACRLGGLVDEGFSTATVLRSVLAAQVLGLGIWLFTAPLIASDFEIVSPVGFLLNVVLIPLATVVLWSGYAFLAACVLVPALAGFFGSVFDAGLACVNWLVALAAEWDLGHLSLPGPPAWWLAGFYLLLFASLIRPDWLGRRLRMLSLLVGWCLVGLVVPSHVMRGDRPPLEIVVLDVGHGGAMLIASADGPCILFDCGSMEDDRRVADAVWRTLRARGRSALDAVIVSHADLDHCNNVPALLKGGPVGTVLIARSFLNFDQRVVEETIDAAKSAGVPIRLVAAGDRLRLRPSVSARILHPPDRPPGDDDNANSIVLELACADRRILLTGDLEGAGQEEVIASVEPSGFDVVAAPHHGGLKANTPRFAEWARPGAVIVSCSDRVNVAALTQIYSGSSLYLTSQLGALTIALDSDGTLAIDGMAATNGGR
jgi:competence protein ComEC